MAVKTELERQKALRQNLAVFCPAFLHLAEVLSSKEVKPQTEKFILAIDLGSTKPALTFVRTDTLETIEDSKSTGRSWPEYNTKTIHLEPVDDKVNDLNYIEGGDLFNMVMGQFEEQVVKNNIDLNQAQALVVTGLTNSLAVKYTNKEGQTTEKIILDNPSVITALTKEQDQILEEHLGPDYRKKGGLKDSSSIMKLLVLKNHPEVVEQLFGDDVHFEDLRFSTMLGVIAGFFGDRSYEQVPLEDLRGFATNNDIAVKHVNKMLFKLGLPQLPFTENTGIVGHGEKPEDIFVCDVLNDFNVETQVDQRLWELGILDPNSILVYTDGVTKVKRLQREPLDPTLRRYDQVEYSTFRMKGRILQGAYDLLRFITEKRKGKVMYEKVDVILDKVKQNQSHQYQFFPGIGLYRKSLSGGKLWEKVKIEEVAQADETTQNEMVLSIVLGSAFQMKELVEKMSVGQTELPNIILTGGLVNMRPTWAEVYAQCLPNSQLLEMPSGGFAAALAEGLKFGLITEDTFKEYWLKRKPKTIEVGKSEQQLRENEYKEWLEAKNRNTH